MYNTRTLPSYNKRANQYVANDIMNASPEELIMKVYDFAIINRANLFRACPHILGLLCRYSHFPFDQFHSVQRTLDRTRPLSADAAAASDFCLRFFAF